MSLFMVGDYPIKDSWFVITAHNYCGCIRSWYHLLVSTYSGTSDIGALL